MYSSTHLLTQWLADESGVTAIEYGLLAALIVVAIVAGVGATSKSLEEVYTAWAAVVTGAL